MRAAWAAICERPGEMQLHKQPVPQVGGTEGLLRVEASGICGTDVAIFDGRFGDRLYPLTLGHEIVGTIAEIGDDAAAAWQVAPGDRVFVEEFLPCRHCAPCRRGQYALCAQTDFIRNTDALRYGATPASVPPALWGAFAQMMYLHPASLVHRLPRDM